MFRSLRAAVLVLVFLVGLVPASYALADSHTAASRSFTDVPADHPDRAHIQYLADRNLINGYPDGRYGVADPLNRAAATKIATQVAGLAARQTGQELTFGDLPAAHWSIPFVRAGVESGLVRGFEDNTFRPEEPLTRAQLAVLAIRATRQSDSRLPSLTLHDVKPEDWFYKQALLAVAAGIMEAPNGSFRPGDVATRAEAARAFAQAMVYTPLAFDTPLAVIVVPQRGVVELRQPGESGWTAIDKATALQEGGRVRTAGASAAAVDFPDGSSLLLDNLTELIVHRSHGTQLVGAAGVEDLDVELVQGKLFFALTPRVSAEEAQAYAPALAAFNNKDADLRAARAMAPRIQAASSHSGENLPDDATRLLLFVDPASLEPGDATGAELTVVLANEAGEPVTASKGPVTLELLTDVGRISNSSPVIPEGFNAVTVTVYPPAEEPEDQKTRITAVAGEVTSALTVPTSKSNWWSNLFAKKTRAKVRMPWSVASVRGTIGSASAGPDHNSTNLLHGDATFTANNGDATDVGQNEGAVLEDPSESPASGPLDLDEQEEFSANTGWIRTTTQNQANNANTNNSDAIDAANNIVDNLVNNLPQDKTPPTIAIGAPGDGQRVGTNRISISGSASDNVKLSSVSVGGQSTGVSSSGNWSTSVTLQPGENTIRATATDGAGNTSSQSVTVIYDAAHPSISLSGPQQTKEQKVTLTGSVSAPGGVQSVTVNGTSVSVGETGGSFSVQVDLELGRNLLSAQVTDKLGRTASADLQITSSSQPPVVTINAGPPVSGKPNYVIGGQAVAQYAELASVSVNGAPVLFSRSGYFAAPVVLKPGDNVITVSATDTVGNTGSDSVTVKFDGAAPAVRIQQPRSGFFTKDAEITVLGEATSALGIQTLTINGRSLPAEAGAFSAAVPLQEGENTITVELVDLAGQTASESKQVFQVTTAPNLVLSTPDDGQIAAKPEITVSGAAAAALGPLRSVSVNGQTMLISGGGFSATVKLQPGPNTLTVTATDMAGNTTSESRTVTYNPLAAILAVSAPTDGLITKEETVRVSGSLTNGELVTELSINGVRTPVSGGGYAASVPLVPGKNVITIALPQDAGGASESVTVIYADRPPTLRVGAPSDGQIVAMPVLTVSGSAMTMYGTPAIVSVNGMLVPVSASGSFSTTVQLKPGKLAITITATDDAGNSATEVRTVEYKPALPLIHIGSPAPNFLTKDLRVTVSGSVTSLIGVDSVSVNGTAASVSASGAFSASVELLPGPNTITVTATDKAQQTASATVTVLRGGVPPELSIGSPGEGFVSGNRVVTVSGSAKAAAGNITSVSVNGTNAAVSASGSWTASITLNPGPNTISVTATDSLGGTASTSRTVVVAEGAPSLEISAPGEGTIVTKNQIVVRGRVKASTPQFSVSVNGAAASVGSDGSFSATVTLRPGPNTISVVATDSLNRTASGSRAVLFAAEKPEISLSVPAEVQQPAVAVSGSVKVAVGLRVTSVTVNGTSARFSDTGSFSANVTLTSLGDNTITVSATDSAGNTVSVSRTVKWTPTPLTININAPASPTAAERVRVSGSVSGAIGVARVSVNGQSTSVTGQGSFSFEIPLQRGTNPINAAVTDSLGRTQSASTSVVFTPAAPTVSISAPATSNSATVAVTARGSSQYGEVTVSVAGGGSESFSGSGQFTTSVGLVSGSNTLRATATDKYGSTSATATVTYTPPAPPPPAPTNTAVVSVVSGTVAYYDDVTFTAVVRAGGNRVVERWVTFLVDGHEAGEGALTDETGTATMDYHVDLAPGTHKVTVTVHDLPSLSANEATFLVQKKTLVVRPGTAFKGDAGRLYASLLTHEAEWPYLTGAINDDDLQVEFVVTDASGNLLTFTGPDGDDPDEDPDQYGLLVATVQHHSELGYWAETDDDYALPEAAATLVATVKENPYYMGSGTSAVPNRPILTVEAPTGPQTSETYTVRGEWTAATTVDSLVAYVNGTYHPIMDFTNGPEGEFEHTVTLQDGPNTIEVVLTDYDGQTVEQTITVNLMPLSSELTLPPVEYGDPSAIGLRLWRGADTPVPGKTVTFLIDGVSQAPVTTNSLGIAALNWHANKAPSTYTVLATYVDMWGATQAIGSGHISVAPERATLEYTGTQPVPGQSTTLTARMIQQNDGHAAPVTDLGLKLQFLVVDSSNSVLQSWEADLNPDGEASVANVTIDAMAKKVQVLLRSNSYFYATDPILEQPVYQVPTVQIHPMQSTAAIPEATILGFWTAPAGLSEVLVGPTVVASNGVSGSFGHTVALTTEPTPFTVTVRDLNGHEATSTVTLKYEKPVAVVTAAVTQYSDTSSFSATVTHKGAALSNFNVKFLVGASELDAGTAWTDAAGVASVPHWTVQLPAGEHMVKVVSADFPGEVLGTGTLTVMKEDLSVFYVDPGPVTNGEITLVAQLDEFEGDLGVGDFTKAGTVMFTLKDVNNQVTNAMASFDASGRASTSITHYSAVTVEFSVAESSYYKAASGSVAIVHVPVITSPGTPSWNHTGAVTVTGRATPGVSLQVLSGDAEIGSGTVDADGTFDMTVTDLPEGEYQLWVLDTANHLASPGPAVLVTVDTTPPTVAVNHMTDISGPTITVAGSFVEAHIKSVKVNNMPATILGSTFSLAVTPATTVNQYTVDVEDQAGHVATATLFVNYAPATTQPRLRLVPRQIPAKVGSTLEVDVLLDNVPTDLAAATFRVAFNPALLEATAATGGDLFTGGLTPPAVLDNSLGYVEYSISDPSGPNAGKQKLATLTFTVRAADIAPLTLTAGSVMMDGDPMEPYTMDPALDAVVELQP